MNILIAQIASALLYSVAGLLVFIILLNRRLILRPDSSTKSLIALIVFIGLVGGGAQLGYFLHRLPWILAPLALFCLVLFGEAHRLIVRHSCAGTMPIDTIPHKVNILKPITTTDLKVHHYKVSHKKWNSAPLRIVHLSDLHVHHSLPLAYYQQALIIAEQTKPDIAVFTGDFIAGLDTLPKLREVLRPIAKLESYAVLGNHDYWANADAVRKVIRDSKLRLLSEESIILPVGDKKITVSGYDYPWDINEKDVLPQESNMLHIVLSHTPDNIYKLSKSHVDFVFSGHYHAGQFRIPALGPIVIPSTYGRRFDHGHFIVNNTHLFVTSGIGVANPPLRIYCHPDVLVVDILPESANLH